MEINVDSIKKLPEGAIYSKTQGQASLQVGRVNSEIIIYATCDSLLLECERYEKKVNYLSSKLKEFGSIKEVEEKPPCILSLFKWCLTGFVTGVVLTIFTVLIIKIKQRKYGL